MIASRVADPPREVEPAPEGAPTGTWPLEPDVVWPWVLALGLDPSAPEAARLTALTGEVIETAVAPGEKSEGDLRAGAAGVEIAGGLGAGIETFGVAIGIGRLALGIEIGRDSAEGGASGGPAAVTETDGAATETGVEGRDADTALPDSSAPQA